MSTSSINNGSQANSEIKVAAAVVPQVHFAKEALATAAPLNPDGDRRRRRHARRDQRATRRFQRAVSIEVEFSSEFTKARDTTDPYPTAQSLFDHGRSDNAEDTFNDVFKKDLIEITGMKGRKQMRKMRIDPYPDALIRWGLHKKEPRENADPVLEDSMMYTLAVAMEIMEGLALCQEAIDRSTLEGSERKAEVDGALVCLQHQLGQRDNRVAVIEEWKEDVTTHMRDIGEAQGLVRGRLTEAELRIRQLQVLVVSQHREVDLLGDVMSRSVAVIEAQRRLIYGMEESFNRKLVRLERMIDPRGRSLGNPIVIEDDPVEDAVVLGSVEERE